MSLADQLRQQDELGEELKRRIKALLREYADQMRAFREKPLPLAAPTGQTRKRSFRSKDGPDYVTEPEYRPTGKLGWVTYVMFNTGGYTLDRYFFVVETDGTPWLDLSCIATVLFEGRYWYTRTSLGRTSSRDDTIFLAKVGNVTEEQLLSKLVEIARLKGLGAVIRPIEEAMLQDCSRLRRS